MFRLSLGLIVGGAVLGWLGFKDWRTTLASTDVAQLVQLSELESGKDLDNYHVKIGPHTACYFGSVYSYERSKYSTAKPEAGTRISHCFYPIISQQHPFCKELEALQSKYGDLAKVPDDVKFPEPRTFAILVKTKRFPTIGAIPDQPIRIEQDVEGLVLNIVDPLGSKEKDLLQKSFPDINFDKVWVVEQGRKPASTGKALGAMAGGGVLSLIGTGLLLMTFRRRN